MSTRAISKEELRKIQLIQVEILLEIDRICKKHNIRYNIIAGTLLGAVRHKGYIPWDDDADVAFLRKDYETFKKACKKELDNENFYFQDLFDTEGYRWGYGKIRKKGTVFLREGQEHMLYDQGVFVDVFPLDGVPDLYPLRVLFSFLCFLLRKIMWSEVGKNIETNKIVRFVYYLLSKIPEKAIRFSYRKMSEKNNNRKTKWVRILTYPTPNATFGYKRSWYEKSALYEFEGNSFQGIKEYDEYLRFKFGDYKKLPPFKERKTHPVSELKVF